MTGSDGTRVDLHVKVLDGGVVERAKARGLDVLVYAPHFTRWPTIERQAETFSDDELTVVPGREIFTGPWHDRRHVLALDLDAPIPDFITLDGAMAELRRQDATVLAPHPAFLSVSLGREQLLEYRHVIDGIEVYNPKHLPWHNRRAQSLASELGLPAFASSYAHLPGTVGEVWTTFEANLRTASDLAEALEDGTRRRLFHRSGYSHRTRKLLEFSHLGYENAWKKFDRIVLSGMEATHPGHVAYGGRFDDVRVV
ncbi:PHP domain-containing protein [Halapricum hydrolyticum]|uniref:PHP domain-containing protein n=1 Tax=Halapricum hydrolyticum TaxID=2979991 RepID=A0AAE3LF46_9EURY|nr:PHP-associated domain-containing protein [Halapricum hydrolyticum]MCU4718021.1 PHP domain-containing protein [Halapricum hydrolyticum]MCU4727186.1 PHP domain-containing protein [Halapricum hydrolyticum]